MPKSISCVKGGCLNSRNGGEPCPSLACLIFSANLSVNEEMDRSSLQIDEEKSLVASRQEEFRVLAARLAKAGISESVILGSMVYALENLCDDYELARND